MKKLLSVLLAFCLLLPGFALAFAADGASMTGALIEKMEQADALTITYVLSLDGVTITDYYKGDQVASDARGGSFPLTIRTLYTGGKGYAFLRALPLFYLPIDPADAPTIRKMTDEMRRAMDGRTLTVETAEIGGVAYTVERFSDDRDMTGFAYQDGALKLILVGNPGEPGGIAVTINSYRFSAPGSVFSRPLIDLSPLLSRMV